MKREGLRLQTRVLQFQLGRMGGGPSKGQLGLEPHLGALNATCAGVVLARNLFRAHAIRDANPKGPKIEKKQYHLKCSISLEKFKIAISNCSIFVPLGKGSYSVKGRVSAF